MANNERMLISPAAAAATVAPGFTVDLNTGDGLVNMDCSSGGDGTGGLVEELSLEEILILYSQPINEEQAWAVCYQCCRTFAQKHRRRRRHSKSSPGATGTGTSVSVVDSAVGAARLIEGPGDVRIRRDGTILLHYEEEEDSSTAEKRSSESPHTSIQVIESLGVMIYKALDYGLKESEERDLSPPLERLIDMMTDTSGAENDPCPDEGYEATEEEDEGDEEPASTVRSIRGYRDIITLCTSHLPSPSDAPDHYQAVCRALFTETRELRTFLEKIKSAKENLRKMEGGPLETREDPSKELTELQNADWARFWVQVMRDLRHGVQLKKVQERQYNPLAIEFQLSPYEMLMDDIRSQRFKLRTVMVNGAIPPRLKKSAHEVILDFIRSRPPLNPAAARKLKPHPPRPRSLHERLLEGIKAERKLRPVSPDMVRRNRLDTPDGRRKLADSTHSLASGTPPGHGVGGALGQRKRLLKAPTLAELDSSGSDEEPTRSTSSPSTSMQEDTSPESVVGVKSPPRFLPMSSTPMPDKRQTPQRRHTIEKASPTSVQPFLAPSRQVSKSLEEFCYPVECLALTVEEVMHIRQVLVKAELEKFQQYKEVYNALKKGKLCFSCRTKKFSLFTWSYTCQFCKRPVCSQCCKKMRLPSKPYATLPIYSLGPSAMVKEETGASSTPAPSDPSPFGSAHHRHSLRRTPSKSSKLTSGGGSSSLEGGSRDELELPKELTEDWATMEVCVDCKKFITEIISSSKRNLSLATKRARLKRKTQSFYMSSPSSANFRPSERSIKEV